MAVYGTSAVAHLAAGHAPADVVPDQPALSECPGSPAYPVCSSCNARSASPVATMRPPTMTCTRSASSCTRNRLKLCDGDDADTPFVCGVLQPARHLAERIDIESRVDFVEDADGRAEDTELHHLGALRLASREVDVERAPQQLRVEADGLRLVGHAAGECRLGRSVGRRRVEQGVQADARHLHGVLRARGRGRRAPAAKPASAVSSCPSIVTEPSVTSVPGRPISAWARCSCPSRWAP